MIINHTKLIFFLVLLLLFSRMGALVHASEHIFEHDHEYCEICSLSDHQSNGLIQSPVVHEAVCYQLAQFSHSDFSLPAVLRWGALSRAPPVS